jgi:HEAT repeat protein
VPSLINALSDKKSQVRQKAVEALGKLGDTRAVEPLIIALKDNNSDVQETAAKALRKLKTPTIESLLVALKEPNWQIRERTAEVLGNLGDTRAVKPLITALNNDVDWCVRWEIAMALRRIGTPEAMAAVDAYEKREFGDVY